MKNLIRNGLPPLIATIFFLISSGIYAAPGYVQPVVGTSPPNFQYIGPELSQSRENGPTKSGAFAAKRKLVLLGKPIKDEKRGSGYLKWQISKDDCNQLLNTPDKPLQINPLSSDITDAQVEFGTQTASLGSVTASQFCTQGTPYISFKSTEEPNKNTK